MGNPIQNLVRLGDPAFSSECQVAIESFALFQFTDVERYNARTWTLPTKGGKTVTIEYRGDNYDAVAPGVDITKTIELEFNLDKDRTIYDKLCIWRDAAWNEVAGTYAQDWSAITKTSALRTNIFIYPEDNNGIPRGMGYKLEHAICKEVAGTSFDVGSADAIQTCSATFSFINYVPIIVRV